MSEYLVRVFGAANRQKIFFFKNLIGISFMDQNDTKMERSQINLVTDQYFYALPPTPIVTNNDVIELPNAVLRRSRLFCLHETLRHSF